MVNVFSFCLYGPENPLYYRGMLENIALIGMFYPTWKVYVYIAPDVADGMRRHLEACSSVVLRDTGVTGPKNMIHRFFAIDEPGVDLMMVRDADSRVHWKDRWAINQFLASPDFTAHAIRDSRAHGIELCGGLWGVRKSAVLSIRALYTEFCSMSVVSKAAHDQDFLIYMVYPRIASRLLIHYSFDELLGPRERGVKFPFTWSQDLFCGRPEVEYIERPEPQRELRLQKEGLGYSKTFTRLTFL